MNSCPLISVVLITYNHERYIRESVDSILSQTYSKLELIIVDDGSTDNTFEIIQEYTDPRVVVVSQENSGPSISLNAGIERCKGEFVAFMSGDDVSMATRLATQLKLILSLEVDILFTIPQIIGPNSEILHQDVCPWFLKSGTLFNDTAQLYRYLFYHGNFLCASSAFCRNSAIQKVGRFKKGLIQLQDFDYWIRACKKNLSIKITYEPLVQYRFLWGGNLSDRRNSHRVEIESYMVYRSYFESVPIDFLHRAFDSVIPFKIEPNQLIDIEIYKTRLFLSNNSSMVKQLGVERLIMLYEDDDAYEKLKSDLELNPPSIFQFIQANSNIHKSVYNELRNVIYNLHRAILRYLGFILLNSPYWTEQQINSKIEYYLARGDHKRAIMVIQGYQKFPLGSTIFAIIFRSINNIVSKSFTLVCGVVIKIFATLKKLRSKILNVINKVARLADSDRNLPDLLGVYYLKNKYQYCKEMNFIVYEVPREPHLFDNLRIVTYSQKDCYAEQSDVPRSYISILENVVVTGGSSLVITRTRQLLSDEMVEFPSTRYDFKSKYVRFRYDNLVIVQLKRKNNTNIKQGVLLSSDIDNDYFQWLVESIPKLVLIDNIPKFRNLPLLIPQGVQKNLIDELQRANKNNRMIIELEHGVAYQLDCLIIPSTMLRSIED